MQDNTNTQPRPRKASALVLAVAMMMTALIGSGAITYTVAAASAEAEIELVPEYESVTYVLDPVTILQRFDSFGTWEKIGNSELTNSTLLLNAHSEGANLTFATNSANYFEVRLKGTEVNSSAWFTLTNASATPYINIGVNGTYVNYTYMDTTEKTGTLVTDGVTLGNWTKLGIEFTSSAVILSAVDVDGTVLGTASLTGVDLTYDLIEEVKILNDNTDDVFVDYIFASISSTAYTPAKLDSNKLNSAATLEKEYQKMLIEFGDKDMAPGTYSDEAVTHSTFGGTPSDKTVSTDRYLNQTDMGEILAAHKETVEPITGTAKYQGWDNLMDDNEDTLQRYIADNHQVAKSDVTVIDYYMTGAKLNYTFNSAMVDAIEQAWFKYASNMADTLGAQTVFVDDADAVACIGGTAPWTMAITKKAVDLNYFYYPGTIESKKFTDALDDLSDAIRDKTLGAALMLPDSFSNITTASKTNPDAYALAADGGLWNNRMQNLDQALQFTDAAIGNILQGATYMLFDLGSAATALDWTVTEDGKFTSTPFTVASLYGSEIVAYGALIVIIAIAILVPLLIFGGIKVKKGRRKN